MTKKKVAAFFTAAALCGALAVGSSMAYLTDHDSVTNKFSVGKVDIVGHEPNYTPDNDGKTNNIVPTQVIKKDPQIENVGKNDAYVYLDVSIPIAKVITVNAAGNRLNGGVAKDTELFSMNNVSKKWTLMYNKRVGDNMVYTYSYNEILAPGKTTDPIFTSLTAANIVAGQLDGKDLNVPVHYYAIQELNTGEGTTIPQKAASAWKNMNCRTRARQDRSRLRSLTKAEIMGLQPLMETEMQHRMKTKQIPQMMFRLSRNRMETTLYHKNTFQNSPESHPDYSEKEGKTA